MQSPTLYASAGSVAWWKVAPMCECTLANGERYAPSLRRRGASPLRGESPLRVSAPVFCGLCACRRRQGGTLAESAAIAVGEQPCPVRRGEQGATRHGAAPLGRCPLGSTQGGLL